MINDGFAPVPLSGLTLVTSTPPPQMLMKGLWMMDDVSSYNRQTKVTSTPPPWVPRSKCPWGRGSRGSFFCDEGAFFCSMR